MLSTAVEAAKLLVVREQVVYGADTMGDLTPLLASFGDPTGPGGIIGAFTIKEALERRYDYDAHLIQYSIYKDSVAEDRWVRINKAALNALEANGFEVKSTVVMVDFDTQPRLPWTTDGSSPTPQKLVPPLMQALREDPLLSCWHAVYLTKKGLRLLYRLKEPISVRLIEGLTCGLYSRIARARGPEADDTLHLDWRCADWTHLFRLPRVVREGTPTYDTEVAYQDNWLDLLSIAPDVKPSLFSVAPATRYEGTCPTIDEVEVNFEVGGAWIDWKRIALRTLSGTEAGLVAAGRKQLVEGDGQRPSGRNDAIHEHVGQAIGKLYPLSLEVDSATKQLTSPETIYGLFLPSVQQFAPDDSSKMTWPQTLWSAVTRIWAKEAGKQRLAVQQKKQSAETKVVEGMTALQRVLTGFGSWCKDPGYTRLTTDSDKATYVKRRLVATPGGQTYYCLQSDGYYSSYACSKDTLVAHATSEQVGMHHLTDFEWQVEGKDGKVKTVRKTAQELIDKSAVVVHSVKGSPKAPGVPGGVLVQSGNHLVLNIQLFSVRDDLEPRYSAEVHGWLLSFGHPELLDFIAKALDLNEVLPILSMVGPPSVGKAMLVRGLAECIPAETVASDRDFGNFSPKFMVTPFLSINEDVANNNAKEVSAIVRELTGGEPIEVNRKHKAPVDVENNLRIIVSANNDKVVTLLLGQGADQTVEDKQALVMRMVHLDVTAAPARYLEGLGGRDHTAKEGAKWIRGSNKVCDYIVAKHFLWLNKNHHRAPKGPRFAMPGCVPDRLLKEMDLGGGTTPVVIETLLKFVESPVAAGSPGILIAPAKYPDRVLITASAIMDFYRCTDEGKKNTARINVNSVGKVLKALRVPGTTTDSREFKNNLGIGQKTRWWEISLETLLAEAEVHGFRCEKTKAVLEANKPTQT